MACSIEVVIALLGCTAIRILIKHMFVRDTRERDGISQCRRRVYSDDGQIVVDGPEHNVVLFSRGNPYSKLPEWFVTSKSGRIIEVGFDIMLIARRSFYRENKSPRAFPDEILVPVPSTEPRRRRRSQCNLPRDG